MLFLMDIDTFFETVENDVSEMQYYIRSMNKIDIMYALESTTEKKKGFFAKAIDKIRAILAECRKMISKVVGAIGNHIRYGLLSKKQKEKFNEYNEYIRKNPQLGRKEVTVKDWNKIMKEYDTVADNIVEMMNDNVTDADGLNLKSRDMMSNLSAMINSSAAAITVDMVLVLGRKSPEMAEKLESQLAQSERMLKLIDEQLGDGSSAKLQKKLHKLTKQSLGQKILSKLYQEKEKSLTDCVKEVTDVFEKIMKGDATKLDMVKAGIEHRSLATTAAKAYIHDPKTRAGVKTVLDMKKKFDSDENIQSAVKIGKEFFNPSGK